MRLLDLNNNEVIKTSLTKKFVLNGKTTIYPVYKIKINNLFYNDQNDRIATYISQYNNDNGDNLTSLDKEEYNKIIEKFIISSNPGSIEKTQNNIELIGQREPGVVLSDGRVIDGNRRFTCIRRLFNKNEEFCYFEGIILDLDIVNDKKQIKMLELNIQHGEDKPVDYNQLEKLVGIYRDITESKLLTPEEYASSTNESLTEVKRKIAAANILEEYLEYIGKPKQFYIARDVPVVSLISHLLDLFKKCKSQDVIDKIKEITFSNLLMNSLGDERKFVKNLASIISNGYFDEFYDAQNEINARIKERYQAENASELNNLKFFSKNNFDLSEELKESMEITLDEAKRVEVKSRPSQIVSKSIKALNEIDLNIVDKLSENQKQVVLNQTKRLQRVVDKINLSLDKDNTYISNVYVKKTVGNEIKKDSCPTITPFNFKERILVENPAEITNLCVSLDIICSNLEKQYCVYFVDDTYKNASNMIELENGENKGLVFDLSSHISSLKYCYLIIKEKDVQENAASMLIKFDIRMDFSADFGF